MAESAACAYQKQIADGTAYACQKAETNDSICKQQLQQLRLL